MLRNRKRLGDLLVEAGKITIAQLKEMLAKQRGTGRKLGEILVDERIITEDEIIDTLEVQLGIRRVNLANAHIDKEALKLVKESLAKKYTLISLDFFGEKLRVVMVDPLNIFAIDDLKIASGKDIIPLIATKQEIEQAIDKYYSNNYAEQMAEKLRDEVTSKRESDTYEDSMNIEDIKNAPVVKLIDTIFSNALKSRASDIHIEPFEDYVKIRYRIDGVIQEVMRVPKESLAAIVTRIKIMSGLNIAEKRVPQDGRIITQVHYMNIDLRVSILPTVHGEKAVIRILDRSSFLKDKSELGFELDDLKKIQNIINSPYGIVLVTGPTGSGKSTTLYTMMSELNASDNNIITIEDPVEYLMDGVNQVNVNTKGGLTFAVGLRSILRQDPDIVMVGEIRDDETSAIAVRAAITGHLVLTTVHTNDSTSAIIRLTDMGIEPYLVATALSGVVAQRLVRRICPKCKQGYKATEIEKDILGVDYSTDLTLYKGLGCSSCGQKGYVGRIGIYEIMEITKKHRELIQRNASIEEIRKLSIESGLKTLRNSCAEKVMAGETTLDELVRISFMKE